MAKMYEQKVKSFQKVRHYYFHNVRQRTKDILQRSCSIRPKIRIYPPSIRDDDVMVTSLNLKIDTKSRSLIKPYVELVNLL